MLKQSINPEDLMSFEWEFQKKKEKKKKREWRKYPKNSENEMSDLIKYRSLQIIEVYKMLGTSHMVQW